MRIWKSIALMVSVVALAACGGGHTPSPGASLPGALAPRDAAVQFLNAVKAQDLQAMSTVWGDERGPARNIMDRSELEKRLIVIQPCYEHDRYQIVGEQPNASGEISIRVALTRGRITKTPNFKVVKGPSNRWYVKDADYSSVREFCTTK